MRKTEYSIVGLRMLPSRAKAAGASLQGLFPEQVDGMRRRYGENSFAKRKKDTMLRCLRRAFINPFHIILFVLGMISLATDVVLASNFARNATTVIIIFSMILTSGRDTGNRSAGRKLLPRFFPRSTRIGFPSIWI